MKYDPPTLHSLKKKTGFGYLDVIRLLDRNDGDLTRAEKDYSDRLEIAKKNATDFQKARRQAVDGGWWMKSFVAKPLPANANKEDKVIAAWRSAKEEFEQKYGEFSSRSFRTLRELDNSAFKGDAFSGFQNVTLGYALATHVIPHFEPDWLALLKEDPFAKLRPLTRPAVAEIELFRNAHFAVTKEDSRSKYIAEALTQAEQYLIAANSTNITIQPDLLYYAAANLAKAVLAPQISDLRSKYRSHGLGFHSNGKNRSLNDFFVSPSGCGLFTALVNRLPGAPIEPKSGPWSLLDLCSLVPDLAEIMDEYSMRRGSNCGKILKYDEHHQNGIRLDYTKHLTPVVTASYLERIGITQTSLENQPTKKVKSKLPSHFWILANDEKIQHCYSARTGELIFAFTQTIGNWDRATQIRLYSLLHQGSLEGIYYVVYNRDKERPHPFVVLIALLYGLSMLARYNAEAWSKLLNSDGLSMAMIDRLIRVSFCLLPIYASEEILSRRILGSEKNIPH
jgi:YaaC-like Protein